MEKMDRRKILCVLLLMEVVLMAFPGCARKPVSDETEYTTPDWFKEAILYEIFVRSFRDSNGDGVGDIKGVTQSLDYLQSLGVTAIWLTPIFPSPVYHG